MILVGGDKMPERHVHVLTFTTWHTIVMGLQCRLQLLKKAKGSCIQFFWTNPCMDDLILAAMAGGFLS